MKKLFTFLMLLSAGNFFAQAPTIEGTYFPVRNTSIKQVWDITPGSMAIPSIGPNQVWDYTNANNQFTHVTDTFRFKMLDPITTPYHQYFPNATHAAFIRTPFNYYSDSLYSFFQVKIDGTYNLGGFSIKHDYDSLINFTNTEYMAPINIAYQTSFTDTSRFYAFAKNYSGYKVKIKGTKYKTETYVAYGTLKLPNGNYNNTALIKETNSEIDSIYVDLLNNGNYTYANFSTSSACNYKFLRNNTFGSAYLAYLSANPSNTQVQYGWYTLPVDFGSISGSVYTSQSETTPVTSGHAYLYREKSNYTKNDILAKVQLDANGNFQFDSIPYGEYRIAIRPNTTMYPYGMITYLGDTTSWLYTPTIITTTSTSTGHKIHIKYHTPPVGANNIAGNLGQNLFIMRSSQTAQSNPVPGIGIIVKKNPGSTNSSRSVVTDNNGDFNIGNLDDGNYTVDVDIPGLHMAGTYSFTVLGNTIVNGLDFVAGTDSIHPTNSLLGVREIKGVAKSSFMTAFPNPYSNEATIVLNLPSSTSVTLEVYNVLGEKVALLDDSQKQAGTYKYTFSAKNSNYSAGMYFVRLKAGNATDVLKIIEQ